MTARKIVCTRCQGTGGELEPCKYCGGLGKRVRVGGKSGVIFCTEKKFFTVLNNLELLPDQEESFLLRLRSRS